ncbi:unnamed protein product [Lactuca virosa]|uniref:Uncharacterized protein n=1 Tax=Lactuca virosa TaxID=75947 RepID=A0AAU9MLE8_9ASTR|nr:unnamed protein product [Lactuca virosa]
MEEEKEDEANNASCKWLEQPIFESTTSWLLYFCCMLVEGKVTRGTGHGLWCHGLSGLGAKCQGAGAGVGFVRKVGTHLGLEEGVVITVVLRGVCVDTNINSFNCGQCFNRCPFFVFCTYGLCGYAGSTTLKPPILFPPNPRKPPRGPEQPEPPVIVEPPEFLMPPLYDAQPPMPYASRSATTTT